MLIENIIIVRINSSIISIAATISTSVCVNSHTQWCVTTHRHTHNTLSIKGFVLLSTCLLSLFVMLRWFPVQLLATSFKLSISTHAIKNLSTMATLADKIKAQGDLVRSLKSNKADKEVVRILRSIEFR